MNSSAGNKNNVNNSVLERACVVESVGNKLRSPRSRCDQPLKKSRRAKKRIQGPQSEGSDGLLNVTEDFLYMKEENFHDIVVCSDYYTTWHRWLATQLDFQRSVLTDTTVDSHEVTDVKSKSCNRKPVETIARSIDESCQSMLPPLLHPFVRQCDIQLDHTPTARSMALISHLSAARTEYVMRLARPILAHLMAHPRNLNLFNEPVDHEALGLNSYLQVVRQPMDLGTVRSRLRRRAYSSFSAFALDVDLVFENAMLFNPPAHHVHSMAADLHAEFILILEHTLVKCRGERVRRLQHNCSLCNGAQCYICGEGCLKHEPVILTCQKAGCGQRVRKNSYFYVAQENAMLWCQKCYNALPSSIALFIPAAVTAPMPLHLLRPTASQLTTANDCPTTEHVGDVIRSNAANDLFADDVAEGDDKEGGEAESNSNTIRTSSDNGAIASSGIAADVGGFVRMVSKRSLLKRRADEEVSEGWVECDGCGHWSHQVCALYPTIGAEERGAEERQERREGEDRQAGAFHCPFCLIALAETDAEAPTRTAASEACAAADPNRSADDVKASVRDVDSESAMNSVSVPAASVDGNQTPDTFPVACSLMYNSDSPQQQQLARPSASSSAKLAARDGFTETSSSNCRSEPFHAISTGRVFQYCGSGGSSSSVSSVDSSAASCAIGSFEIDDDTTTSGTSSDSFVDIGSSRAWDAAPTVFTAAAAADWSMLDAPVHRSLAVITSANHAEDNSSEHHDLIALKSKGMMSQQLLRRGGVHQSHRCEGFDSLLAIDSCRMVSTGTSTAPVSAPSISYKHHAGRLHRVSHPQLKCTSSSLSAQTRIEEDTLLDESSSAGKRTSATASSATSQILKRSKLNDCALSCLQKEYSSDSPGDIAESKGDECDFAGRTGNCIPSADAVHSSSSMSSHLFHSAAGADESQSTGEQRREFSSAAAPTPASTPLSVPAASSVAAQAAAVAAASPRSNAAAEAACSPSILPRYERGASNSLLEMIAGAGEDSWQWRADSLPRSAAGDFLEALVRGLLLANSFGEETASSVTVRMVSNRDFAMDIPTHIGQNIAGVAASSKGSGSDGGTDAPRQLPDQLGYRQKCFLLFQRIDGVDICLFCLYVQEFNALCPPPNTSAVYIAYLDSVDYFRPMEARSMVYQELVGGYLLWAQARGFRRAHIWSCPPQRGDNFIFYAHPPHQRTPSRDRLNAWYKAIITRCSRAGVVQDSSNMWRKYFLQYVNREGHNSRQVAKQAMEKAMEVQKRGVGRPRKKATLSLSSAGSGASPSSRSSPCQRTHSSSSACQEDEVACPPVFEGDFWTTEFVKLCTNHLCRISNATSQSVGGSSGSASAVSRDCFTLSERQQQQQQQQQQGPQELKDRQRNSKKCRETLQQLVRRDVLRIFVAPVDPIAMNLPTYTKVVKHPMDFGTVRDKMRMGSYRTALDFVQDVRLVFSNAKLFNPPDHYVYEYAASLCAVFEHSVSSLRKSAPQQVITAAVRRESREAALVPAEDGDNVLAAMALEHTSAEPPQDDQQQPLNARSLQAEAAMAVIPATTATSVEGGKDGDDVDHNDSSKFERPSLSPHCAVDRELLQDNSATLKRKFPFADFDATHSAVVDALSAYTGAVTDACATADAVADVDSTADAVTHTVADAVTDVDATAHAVIDAIATANAVTDTTANAVTEVDATANYVSDAVATAKVFTDTTAGAVADVGAIAVTDAETITHAFTDATADAVSIADSTTHPITNAVTTANVVIGATAGIDVDATAEAFSDIDATTIADVDTSAVADVDAMAVEAFKDAIAEAGMPEAVNDAVTDTNAMAVDNDAIAHAFADANEYTCTDVMAVSSDAAIDAMPEAVDGAIAVDIDAIDDAMEDADNYTGVDDMDDGSPDAFLDATTDAANDVAAVTDADAVAVDIDVITDTDAVVAATNEADADVINDTITNANTDDDTSAIAAAMADIIADIIADDHATGGTTTTTEVLTSAGSITDISVSATATSSKPLAGTEGTIVASKSQLQSPPLATRGGLRSSSKRESGDSNPAAATDTRRDAASQEFAAFYNDLLSLSADELNREFQSRPFRSSLPAATSDAAAEGAEAHCDSVNLQLPRNEVRSIFADVGKSVQRIQDDLMVITLAPFNFAEFKRFVNIIAQSRGAAGCIKTGAKSSVTASSAATSPAASPGAAATAATTSQKSSVLAPSYRRASVAYRKPVVADTRGGLLDLPAACRDALLNLSVAERSARVDPDRLICSPFADSRHTFLEMCQYRHYQFDSLRRAKHASLMILYHLHHPYARRCRPLCSSCGEPIQILRWHCDQCADFDLCPKCYRSGLVSDESGGKSNNSTNIDNNKQSSSIVEDTGVVSNRGKLDGSSIGSSSSSSSAVERDSHADGSRGVYCSLHQHELTPFRVTFI